MPIRELTDDERDRLLTQAEVNELDDGTEVMVKWNGGNGPHRYTISTDDRVDYPNIDGTPLNYVGEKPRQRVFLPE